MLLALSLAPRITPHPPQLYALLLLCCCIRVLLVQHIEDVGSILSALRAARYRHLDRKAFRSLMYDTLGNRAMVRVVGLGVVGLGLWGLVLVS